MDYDRKCAGGMGVRKTVRFYYSIGSRYSYLASTQIGRLERETGCEVVWRPLYSVDLYRLRGISPFEGEPVSGQYDWDYRRQDAERSLRGTQGRRGLRPAAARPCLRRRGRAGCRATLRREPFSAIFAESLPEVGEDVCLERAEALGLSGGAFTRELASPRPDRRLAETAEEARSAGAFGVPTFVVDGKTFWGNDRLVLVRYHLSR